MEITRHCFPLSIFFMHCLMVCLTINADTNITTDKHSLLSLKSKIFFDPYNILANNWSANSTSPCNWIGVTCSTRHNRVTTLDLSNMSLVGELSPYLGNLSFLVSLNLSHNNFHNLFPQELCQLRRLISLSCSFNDFSGEIPSWLGLLPNLKYLHLGNNIFSGFLPTSLFNLSKLEVLHLGVNSLLGSIPKEIGSISQLNFLNLSYNHLNGPFPLGILNLSMLKTLSLSANSLSGDLPLDLGNHLPKLLTFNMRSNKFSGEIPSSLSRCSQLQTISLAYNNFSGNIPKEFENITKLEVLNLHQNQLIGIIPKEIGNLTTLKDLYLGTNFFKGSIPQELGKLDMLELLELGDANLSGSIPVGIFNISSLQEISLSGNELVGTLPTTTGRGLPELQGLYLEGNFLSGVIPDSISNCSKLTLLCLGDNRFNGSLPTFLGNLRVLNRLHLFNNMFTNDAASPELSIINSLVNCKYLVEVRLDDNPLHAAALPASIGNLSSSLQFLSIMSCGLKGTIPNQLGNLSGLIDLNLYGNELSGFIPAMFGGEQKLQRLHLGNNKLGGPIPHSLCELQSLGELELSNNQVSGSLPTCFGNSTSLRNVYLGSNHLSSGISSSLCSLKDLLVLDLSSNFLDGSLPIEINGLKALYMLDLSNNQISGNIPITIGQLQNLQTLSLAQNRLEGNIPETISQIISLEFLDLSFNKLSGSIPMSLEGLTYLEYFNVSFNKLTGEIPSSGCFKNLTSSSFMSNEGLCGISSFHVPPCHSTHHSKIHKVLPLTLAPLGAALIITFVIIALLLRKKQKGCRVTSINDIYTPWAELKISYAELSRATCGFSQNNVIGSGSIGSVYKGILGDEMPVAVKVFNQSDVAFKSFDVECEVLKNLRHRNLTKVITGCFVDNFKALVLEYMPNGSLDQWLHSQSNFLDIVQRINIMIDVACALEYLHHGYTTLVVHCDLKPANVLLDEEMVAHVSDFSVTKLLTEEESFTQTETLATLGYMAPEYGLTGMVSRQCDIYSFGIVLMETFSKRRPTDEGFSEDMSLRSWIRDSLPHHVLQVVDPNLLGEEDRGFTVKLQCVSSILELALNCAMESPENRLDMKQVVAKLNGIKHQFLRSGAVTSTLDQSA